MSWYLRTKCQVFSIIVDRVNFTTPPLPQNEPVKSLPRLGLNSLIMCKEGWCVGLGQEGSCLCEGNCLEYLKRGGIEKEGVAGSKKLWSRVTRYLVFRHNKYTFIYLRFCWSKFSF